MKRILGCFIFLMITSQIFAGTVYYVDATNGNDANPGSKLLPWRTIQKAADTMVAGDSVTVYEGTYTERVTESSSGSSGNLITYQINSGDTVTVDGGFVLSGNYIRVEGFNIKATGSTWSTTGTGVYITGDYCEIEDNYFTQCTLNGIRLNDSSSYCTIKGNYIYQVAFTGIEVQGNNHLIEDNEIEDIRCIIGSANYGDADGVRFFGSGHVFRGNHIHDITYENNPGKSPHIDGFQTWNHGVYAGMGGNNCTFEKNLIELPSAQSINAVGTGFQLEGSGGGISNLTIKNNIIKCFRGILLYYDHNGHIFANNTIIGDLSFNTSYSPRGISLELLGSYTIENLTVENNIICEQPWRAIYLSGPSNGDGDGNVIDYNCKYNSDDSTPQGTVQPHDLWGIDPKLVNLVGAKQGGGDEHLQSDSPCIEAGTTISEVTHDYDGNSRPYGAWYDIGAYEYVGVYPPLSVNINASPTSGEVPPPLTVNFTGGATGGVLPYSYSWDFGDGTSSSEQIQSHTYYQAGVYTVTLTVTDSENNQDSESITINVSASTTSLEASFIASPILGYVPLTVNFTGGATGGVLPYSYSWDFGDGTSSSEQIQSHTYSQAGVYTVTLTVTDSESNQDEDSLTIDVRAVITPLEASCAASPTSGEVPLTVNFTGNATGGVLPYSYSWDFGNGTSSSEQNPIHTYSQAGDYTVTLTVTDNQSNQDNDSLTINASAVIPTYLSCSPTSFYFGATTSGNETQDQYLRIINAGSGILTWNIEDDAYWLSCSPSSGTDRGEITVSVNALGLSLGLYIATITVSSPEAYNSPQYVSVNLRVYEPEQESPPFGSLDTPVDGSTVSGSIPVTGWALDDIEVVRLEIKRNSDPVDPLEAIGPNGLVYIGDAVFVEGARPDVEKSYADYPLNSRAGWGYMLLTNDLPYRGNGSFTIYTFAYDASGQREEIGRKTILCDNANRVKPFGTIDTREQGESIGGSDYINFGWALTPLPKTIPKDGSTISVWVDGVQVGHPVYDQYWEDIATLYPEYNNAQGAVGYYYLDTTQYENGVHTIAWSVMDDEGEADEIGARYFSINNIETGSTHDGSLGLRSIYREDVEERLRIGIKEVGKEYRPQVDDDREIDTKSILKIQIEEMEPLRIVLEESSSGNMEYIGWGENKSKALPIGSTLDREKGIFSWIPTPGFIGNYVFHFAVTDGSYMSKPLRVEVNVIPKSYDLD